jgi:5'-phosphate synthase pdxT subunit
MSPTVGILALQGGFEAHAKIVQRLGATPREVRVPAELEGVDALILPGGESTVMTLGMEREGLAEPLREVIARGTPTLATCAGMIILDREHLGLLDITTRRNAFGRQLHSFEADLPIQGIEGGPIHAVFIRAPWVADHGDRVQPLGEVDGHLVAIRQDNVTAVAFHPELAGESRLHRALLNGQEAPARGRSL